MTKTTVLCQRSLLIMVEATSVKFNTVDNRQRQVVIGIINKFTRWFGVYLMLIAIINRWTISFTNFGKFVCLWKRQMNWRHLVAFGGCVRPDVVSSASRLAAIWLAEHKKAIIFGGDLLLFGDLQPRKRWAFWMEGHSVTFLRKSFQWMSCPQLDFDYRLCLVEVSRMTGVVAPYSFIHNLEESPPTSQMLRPK